MISMGKTNIIKVFYQGKGGLVLKNKSIEKLEIKRGCMGLRVALPALMTKPASREI